MTTYYPLEKLRIIKGFERAKYIDPYAGAEYFKRMQKLNLYTIDTEEIARRISKWNLSGVFEEKLV
jgi:hypothetical protein